MTEIKNCLPETAWKHFIDLRNIRLSTETNKYQQRLQNLRAELAAKGQGRSGWQEKEEWQYKVDLWDSLANGYVEDAFETCRLYDIELTRQLCDCFVKATGDLLEGTYNRALQMKAQGVADAKIPLAVRQQGGSISRRIMPQIRVMIEAARVEDEKKRVALRNESRLREATAIHIHNSNVTNVDAVKPQDTNRWSRTEILTAVGVIIAVLAILAGWLSPEVRRFLHLEKSSPTPAQVVPQAQTPQSELPTVSGPSPRPHNKAKSLSENALALAANIRKLSQEWRTEQATIDTASDVTEAQRKSMSSVWATKVMAEYDSKYKADARIIHDQLLTRLPAGTDPLAMKDGYENEVNPGWLEIIASNLEHLAKLLREETSNETAAHPRMVSGKANQPPPVSQECAPGASCAISSGQHGGITAGKIIVNPPVNPNKPPIVYDCVGSWKSAGPSADSAMMVVTCLPDKCEKVQVFNDMVALNNAAGKEPSTGGKLAKCSELQAMCDKEIKTTPEWLTPWLFRGAAEACVGDLVKLKETLAYYDEHIGPTYNIGQCKNLSDFLHAKLNQP